MTKNMTYVSLLLLFMTSFTLASETIFDGQKPIKNPLIRADQVPPNQRQAISPSRRQIARVLEAASKVTTVSDVMALKESGLRYVTSLDDLDYLTTFTVSNPSHAYITATGDFIAAHVETYTLTRADLIALIKLETKAYSVDQAMACKKAGLKVVTSLASFLKLLSFNGVSPSFEYQKQVSQFAAAHISRFVGPRSSIALILQVEKFGFYVEDAMTIKSAGLVAVQTKEQLLALAEYAFKNPTADYVKAVATFIRIHFPNYP